jgi:hypothetical protein
MACSKRPVQDAEPGRAIEKTETPPAIAGAY